MALIKMLWHLLQLHSHQINP